MGESAGLAREFDYYLEHQDELVLQYDGKFVVIKDCAVLGAYDTLIQAITDTQRDHELGTFLVQAVSPGPDAYTQSHSRVMSLQMPGPFAFTMTADGTPNVMLSEWTAGPAGADESTHRSFRAIWDTGATRSAITQQVVDECGLKPSGKRRIEHAGVADEADVYAVDIALPNRVLIESIEASRLSFAGGDVLIGMDIINMGDFAITHPGGQSKFTFQIPAQADIDS